MKKSFTLIEIMIALMIVSILFLAMNGLISNLKITKKVLDRKYFNEKRKELLIKVLYNDILNATSFRILHSRNSNYDRLYLTTSNSLYNLINPNVLWYVSKNKNTLIRVESPFKIVLPNYKLFFLDKFLDGVKIFKIYSKKSKYLVVLKLKKAFYFEFEAVEHNTSKHIKKEGFLPVF